MASNEIDYNSEQYRRFFYNAEEFENFKKFLNGYNELKNIDNEPKQTCLEKRGFVERKRLLNENISNDGYGKGERLEYSDRHKNAISERNKVKGKGSQSGGHTYFQPYFGKPNGTMNRIEYKNFVTLPTNGTSIGGKIDIDKREELELTKRYNTRNEYSSKNKDALSTGNIHGKGTGLYLDTKNGGGGYDIRLRAEHIEQNDWRENDIEYSKPLIDAEYMIQTEFKVGSTDETVEEQYSNTVKREENEKAKEIKKNKTDRDKKRDKKAAQTPDQLSSKPRQDVQRTESVNGEIASKDNVINFNSPSFWEHQNLATKNQVEFFNWSQRFAPNQQNQ